MVVFVKEGAASVFARQGLGPGRRHNSFLKNKTQRRETISSQCLTRRPQAPRESSPKRGVCGVCADASYIVEVVFFAERLPKLTPDLVPALPHVKSNYFPRHRRRQVFSDGRKETSARDGAPQLPSANDAPDEPVLGADDDELSVHCKAAASKPDEDGARATAPR